MSDPLDFIAFEESFNNGGSGGSGDGKGCAIIIIVLIIIACLGSC